MIKKGVLHSRCTRATILARVAEMEVSVGPVAATSSPVALNRHYRLKLPSSTPEASAKEFEESLAKLAKAYRATLVTLAPKASPPPTRHRLWEAPFHRAKAPYQAAPMRIAIYCRVSTAQQDDGAHMETCALRTQRLANC
jgi:hypothetical protein